MPHRHWTSPHAQQPRGCRVAATLGVWAATLACPPLWAQAPAAGNEPQVMPTLRAKVVDEPSSKEQLQATSTRIGKGQQDARDLPQSLTVITERLIDDRNLDTLKDALKNSAGITFMAAEGSEEDIRLRGFPLQATGDMFADSMRDPALYERDTFFLDWLEVLRGSASLLSAADPRVAPSTR